MALFHSPKTLWGGAEVRCCCVLVSLSPKALRSINLDAGTADFVNPLQGGPSLH